MKEQTKKTMKKVLVLGGAVGVGVFAGLVIRFKVIKKQAIEDAEEMMEDAIQMVERSSQLYKDLEAAYDKLVAAKNNKEAQLAVNEFNNVYDLIDDADIFEDIDDEDTVNGDYREVETPSEPVPNCFDEFHPEKKGEK